LLHFAFVKTPLWLCESVDAAGTPKKDYETEMSIWQLSASGPTVRLRPVKSDDYQALFDAASDPLIWAQHPEPTRWQPAVFRRFFDGAIACGGALVIEGRESGRIIGSSRFDDHRPQTRSVEIGYTFLARAFWGGTVNAEVKSLMLAHAFAHVDSVWFVVGESNWRSRKAMEKIGGRLHAVADAPVGGDLSGKVTYVIRRPGL
jgi:N-acetyltransferase